MRTATRGNPMTTHTIFGAGPAGLYTAWRLATCGQLGPGDAIHLVEWGDYAFDGTRGTRRPAGRICTHHHEGDAANSYVEIGGMRYIEYDPDTAQGHQLVTRTISALGLDDDVVPFLTTTNPMFFLRNRRWYLAELESGAVAAPFDTPANTRAPDDVVATVANTATHGNEARGRSNQCDYFATGTLHDVTSQVYADGDPLGNIGFWNFLYDQVGSEGYAWTTAGAGYNSNTINWNTADASIYLGEFAPGGTFKTLKTGYSHLFVELFRQARAAAAEADIGFALTPRTRLHSIWLEGDEVWYHLADADDPDVPDGPPATTDHAFLAMPRHSIELVARASRYSRVPGRTDFLNDLDVRTHLESVIEQPSYKVAMFFDRPWWQDAPWAPKLVNGTATANVFGPTVTDLPLRQVYYFGDNSRAGDQRAFGLLASYDDMTFVDFWKGLELDVHERRTTPGSLDEQALVGGTTAPPVMVRMLMAELARLHYDDVGAVDDIPAPLETVFMDWSNLPFGAGYHAWASHYDISAVMAAIRRPGVLAGVPDAPVYIVGSAWSDDQAWVEGAFCTAESVLAEFLDIPTEADTTRYPLICGTPSRAPG